MSLLFKLLGCFDIEVHDFCLRIALDPEVVFTVSKAGAHTVTVLYEFQLRMATAA